MKAAFFKALAFGVGFALTVVLLAGAWLWYSSRPRPEQPWNSTAFKASLSNIDAWESVPDRLDRNAPGKAGPWEKYQKSQPSKSGTLEFTYIVENGSGRDYSTNGDSVLAMVRRPDGLTASDEAITVKYPIFIPAGQKVAVIVSIPYGDILGSADKNVDLRKVVREQLPKLLGFVLFDQTNRYQVELPKGW